MQKATAGDGGQEEAADALLAHTYLAHVAEEVR